MKREEAVARASFLLVKHFRDCLERDGEGLHSRVFTYFLHPESNFVAIGQSQEVMDGEPGHPEHLVPCSVLIKESCRLIKERVPDEQIADLLSKHWKIAYISKKEASILDSKNGLGLKESMPDGWTFEDGGTYERLNKAKITIYPFESIDKP